MGLRTTHYTQQQQQQQGRYRQPKLPTFDPSQIDLWLGSVYNEFETCGLTDLGRKKSEILREISKEHRPQIQDFYLNPDTSPDGPLGYPALITQLRTLFREKDR